MSGTGSNILVGWKEIAAYLGCCEDTARGFEHEKKLPIYRHGKPKRGRRVRALRSELDQWVKKTCFSR